MSEQQARSHAIDMSSVLRGKGGRNEPNETCIKVENLNLFYGEKQALHDINMEMSKKKVTAYIGPSGCGKSTLLRCINRMNDLVDSAKIDGKILLNGENIYDKAVNVAALRRRVGMVFQKPNPFPKSILKNEKRSSDISIYKVDHEIVVTLCSFLFLLIILTAVVCNILT